MDSRISGYLPCCAAPTSRIFFALLLLNHTKINYFTPFMPA
jgi:hypothetical protein